MRIKFPPLQYRVEYPKIRCGIGARPCNPLPPATPTQTNGQAIYVYDGDGYGLCTPERSLREGLCGEVSRLLRPKRLLREGYDPVIGHFIQADTIVPEAGSSKAYDRYGYVNNNPVRYNDPSGRLLTVVRFGPRLDPSEGSGKW
jgi:hypothetical protein